MAGGANDTPGAATSVCTRSGVPPCPWMFAVSWVSRRFCNPNTEPVHRRSVPNRQIPREIQSQRGGPCDGASSPGPGSRRERRRKDNGLVLSCQQHRFGQRAVQPARHQPRRSGAFDGRTPRTRGFGCTEGAIVYLAEGLARIGHHAVVFNSSPKAGAGSAARLSQASHRCSGGGGRACDGWPRGLAQRILQREKCPDGVPAARGALETFVAWARRRGNAPSAEMMQRVALHFRSFRRSELMESPAALVPA